MIGRILDTGFWRTVAEELEWVQDKRYNLLRGQYGRSNSEVFKELEKRVTKLEKKLKKAQVESSES